MPGHALFDPNVPLYNAYDVVKVIHETLLINVNVECISFTLFYFDMPARIKMRLGIRGRAHVPTYSEDLGCILYKQT